MSMARGKLLANALCHPLLIYHPPSVNWMRCVLQVISDASEEKPFGHGPPCSRPIPINGWVRFLSIGRRQRRLPEKLRQAKSAISTYIQAQAVPPSQAVIRLDGQYGNGAIVADLARTRLHHAGQGL